MKQKNDYFVEEILGIQFETMCSDGKKRVISVNNFKRPMEKLLLSMEKDYEEMPTCGDSKLKQFCCCRIPLYKISFDLTCRGYDMALIDVEEDIDE